MNATIDPCPFCGNKFPFAFISIFHVNLECDCGATLRKSSARVLYKRDELPPELVDKAHPANALIIIDEKGNKVEWPEHGYYGIPANIALDHAGVLSIWNTRTSSK